MFSDILVLVMVQVFLGVLPCWGHDGSIYLVRQYNSFHIHTNKTCSPQSPKKILYMFSHKYQRKKEQKLCFFFNKVMGILHLHVHFTLLAILYVPFLLSLSLSPFIGRNIKVSPF